MGRETDTEFLCAQASILTFFFAQIQYFRVTVHVHFDLYLISSDDKHACELSSSRKG